MKPWLVVAALWLASMAQAETLSDNDQTQVEMWKGMKNWILSADKDAPKVSVVIGQSIAELRLGMNQLVASIPKKRASVINPSVFVGRLQMFSLSKPEAVSSRGEGLNLVAGTTELSLALWDVDQARDAVLQFLSYGEAPDQPISLIYVPLQNLLMDTPTVNYLFVNAFTDAIQALNPTRTRLMFVGSRQQWVEVMAQPVYQRAFENMESNEAGLALFDFSRLFVTVDCASTLQTFN